MLHTGVAANIVDEHPLTRVDSWNGSGTDPDSFVGVNWGGSNLQTVATLEVRDNFPITGPAGRRFLKARVTAVP